MDGIKPIVFRCLAHRRSNEIYCTACSTYLCPECVSLHSTPMHKPRYVHALQYAKSHTLSKLDLLANSTGALGAEKEVEVSGFFSELRGILPAASSSMRLLQQKISQLKVLIKSLKSYVSQSEGEVTQENIVNELNIEKKRLEELIKKKNPVELIRLIQKTEEEVKLSTEQEKAKDLVSKLRLAMVPMEDQNMYDDLTSAASILNTKCNVHRFEEPVKEWRCDRKYLSSKMQLSDDGLTFGNTASNGYPAIIGDLPFDSGLYAYEVVPLGLDCAGKEGFGVIEKSCYLRAVSSDKVTPVAYNEMIGYFYKGEVRRMTVKKKSDMQMGQKYVVRVNIPEQWMTIKGPELQLKAQLEANTVYYPCFSCGCSGNKFHIKPLPYAEE